MIGPPTPADPQALVRAAAHNNAEWCDAVCRAHGMAGEFRAGAWTSERRTPRRYPDAVTLRPDVPARAVLGRIDTTSGCSVKDSFAALDLSAAGFEVLFDAQWIHGAHPAEDAGAGVRWEPVRHADDLAAWESTMDGGAGLFRPALLVESAVAVLAGRVRGRLVAGAVASRSGSVVGVSNLFSTDGDLDGAWAGCLRAVARRWPGTAVVGYERGPELAAAVRAGLRPIGPLRVWWRGSGPQLDDGR